MKAWYVWERDAEAGEIHWAETAGKAKVLGLRKGEWIQGGADWIYIRAKREPKFDGEPRELKCRDWMLAEYAYLDDGFGKPECDSCEAKSDCDYREGADYA